MKTTVKYIIATIAGFILAILLMNQCNSKKPTKAEVKIKTDTIYKIQEKKIYIKDTIVKLKYVNKTLTNTIVKEEIQKNIKEDYTYNLDTVYKQDKVTTNLKIKGWGYINDIKLSTEFKDTTTIINKELTKYLTPTTVYVSGIYGQDLISRKANIGIGLDLTVKNKLIVGTSIGYSNEPNFTFKVGYKIN